jgi:isopenicillin-N epimerase
MDSSSDSSIASQWTLDPGVAYLNHGSFGPSPDVVRRARERYSEELEREPMDFLVRRMEPRLDQALKVLGRFVGASPGRLAFVPNATCGMNVALATVELKPGDEVLFTDQEYGSVVRAWGGKCAAVGVRTVLAQLPSPPESPESIVDAIFARVTPATRVIVVSHVTSQTATVVPVREICRVARARGIAVCIDGPHALAMQDLKLDELDADFYCASGHKWLAAPFGSGFLYVAPRWQGRLKPAVTSWGRSLTGRPERWQDELHWFGTYDPAPYLAMVDSIAFLEQFGLQKFRDQTHALAHYARTQLIEQFGAEPLTPDTIEWYGSMVTVRLPGVDLINSPRGEMHPLQKYLWVRHRIEVPIVQWKNRVHLRVSCHLYNSTDDVHRLVGALDEWPGP